MQNVGHIKLQSLVNVNVTITEENIRLLYQMGQGLHIQYQVSGHVQTII